MAGERDEVVVFEQASKGDLVLARYRVFAECNTARLLVLYW